MNELIEVPCKCGFSPTPNPDEFYISEISVAKILIHNYELPKMKVYKCKNCDETSILSRVE